MNEIYWDKVAKEPVLLSNFRDEKPFEGIVLRCMGFENQRAIMGWTIRAVNPENLDPYPKPHLMDRFEMVVHGRQSKFNLGRV